MKRHGHYAEVEVQPDLEDGVSRMKGLAFLITNQTGNEPPTEDEWMGIGELLSDLTDRFDLVRRAHDYQSSRHHKKSV